MEDPDRPAPHLRPNQKQPTSEPIRTHRNKNRWIEAELQARGVNLHSLREGIDFSTPTGRLQAAIFSAMAEYERELLKERAAAAREAAKARGRQVGRPRALTLEQADTAVRMREARLPISTIATTLGVSRATVYRYTEPASLNA